MYKHEGCPISHPYMISRLFKVIHSNCISYRYQNENRYNELISLFHIDLPEEEEACNRINIIYNIYDEMPFMVWFHCTINLKAKINDGYEECTMGNISQKYILKRLIAYRKVILYVIMIQLRWIRIFVNLAC